jgi:hypothetical protein
MSFLKRWSLALATGYSFVVFSEHMFWSRYRVNEDSLGNYLAVWLAYSLVAFVFLWIVQFFRVRSLWSLFLAGAVVGWLAEGVIVQTTYESLPLSISFTGLAWHALLTVLVGWYGLRQALSSSLTQSLFYSTLIGTSWAFWAIHHWGEAVVVTPPLNFAVYATSVTVTLVLAQLAWNWAGSAFTPSRLELGIVLSLFVLYFAFVTVPATPVALLILPFLLGTVLLSLWRNRRLEPKGSVLEPLSDMVPLKRMWALLLIPLFAGGLYTLAHGLVLEIKPPTHWLVYLITTPLGFIFFFVSLVKIWREAHSKPKQQLS